MNDEPIPKNLEYKNDSGGKGSIKKPLMWVVPLVIIIVVLFIIINQRPGKNDSEYTALISKANTSFSLKEYREAKKDYEAALRIKPAASLPIERITVIDSILTFREESRIKEAAEKEISEPAEVSQDRRPEKAKPAGKTALPKKNEEPKAKTPPIGSGRYHIVVACFEIKSNAINYSKKLGGKGLNSRIIPILDGRMSAVTYQSFRTEKEAFKTLRQVQRDFAKEAWVLEH